MKYFIGVVLSLLLLVPRVTTVLAAPIPITLSTQDIKLIPLPSNGIITDFTAYPTTKGIIEIDEKNIKNRQIPIHGKKIGKTLFTVTHKDGYHAEYLINVIIENVKQREVDELIKQIYPDGKVTATLTPSEKGNGRLILQGSVPTKSKGERLQKLFTALDYTVVNMLAIEGSQQVQLFVRVAEVVKGTPMSIGLNFGSKKDGWLVTTPGIGMLATLTGSINSGQATAADYEAFNIGVTPPGGDYFGVLSLMEGHHLAKILAQPTLVVESGHSARFHAGGEFAISTTNNDGNVEIEFKEYGVLLAFTPDILEDGNIHIRLEQEVSNLDWANSVLNIPGLRVRKTETSVQLKDGESFMISGLLQEEIRSLVNKIPLLGDIPVLGALFRSSSYEKNQTELAIVVTPRIVNPMAAGEKVHLPGEQLTTPSPFQAFLLGKIVRRTNEEAAYVLLGTAGLETP